MSSKFLSFSLKQYSGSFQKLGADPAKLVHDALRNVSQQGSSVDVRIVPGDELRETARQAAEDGYDVIAASGGDGTINGIVNAIQGTGTTLGVIPSGTFNHFAKDTGIPLDFPSAIRNLVEGEPQQIDLAEVNGHFFVNNSSVGQYPLSVITREEHRKRFNINKKAAMIFAVLRTSFLFPRYELTAQIQGWDAKTLKTPLIFIGNNRYDLSPFRVGTRSRLTEGMLCGYASLSCHLLDSLYLVLLMLFQSSKLSKKFAEVYFTQLTLSSNQESLDVAMDGEVKQLVPPLIYRIHPKALSLILPKT